MDTLIDKIRENDGISFGGGNVTINDFDIKDVDLDYVKNRLSKIKKGKVSHADFGDLDRSIVYVGDYYDNEDGNIIVVDSQDISDIKTYSYRPVGEFNGLTLFVTTDIKYLESSAIIVNLDEEDPRFTLSDDNFVSPYYEFIISHDSNWTLNRLSDPLLKDYIREEFDHHNEIDAFIYYIRYLIIDGKTENIYIKGEAEYFFNGDSYYGVEYLKNGFYEYIYDKFISGDSVLANLSYKDRKSHLDRYKFVTIYGDEVSLKDYSSSNVPCFKIYRNV